LAIINKLLYDEIEIYIKDWLWR